LIKTDQGQDSCFEGIEGCFCGFFETFFDCDCNCQYDNSKQSGEHFGTQVAKSIKNFIGVLNRVVWGVLSLFTSIYVIIVTSILLFVLYYTYPIYGPFVKTQMQKQYNILMYATLE